MSGAEARLQPAAPSENPWAWAWRQLRRNRMAAAGGSLLGILYFCAVFAGLLAPYGYDNQDRDTFYHPPTRIHVRSAEGGWQRPFVYRSVPSRTGRGYEPDTSKTYPIRLFVRGDGYKILGLVPSSLHLFGVDEPARIYPVGSDLYGRDVLSRILYGSQISLSIGLVGITVTVVIGMLIGGLSGYYGGIVDNLLMRLSELIMMIPGLFLILALRAAFPVDMSSTQMYLLLVFILSFIGWAGLSRVIRGMVLSIREREFVTAARAAGASSLRIIVRHILPNTLSYVIVAATLYVPYYILGEVVLSFLGVGIQEPQASWGNMLNAGRSVRVLSDYPWVLIPGAFIFVAVLAYNFLGDGLRDALDPRMRLRGGRPLA